MSFDLSGLPTKTEFESNNPAPVVNAPTEQEVYDRRKARVEQRIVRFFSRTGGNGNSELKVRVGFLTEGDKAALVSGVEAKGFSCVESNGLMTIN